MTRAADLTPQEEATLLAALRRRDAMAYDELVRLYGPALLGVARRLMRHEHDAQDAVQDGLLSAFRALPRFRGDSRLSTWLHRIVVNAALMQMRRRRRRPEAPLEPFLPRFTADTGHVGGVRAWHSSEIALVEKEARAAMRAAIGDLPERYRTVLILRDIEEYTTHDVATQIGVTTNAIKVRLHRARRALVTRLTPVLGVDQSVGASAPSRREIHT